MLESHIRRASGLRPGLRSQIAIRHTNSPAFPQSCSYTWWQKQRDWPSPLDPENERYIRSRTLSTKAKLKRTLQRQAKWDKPSPSTNIPPSSRWDFHACISDKPSRRSFDENEDGQRSTHSSTESKKQHLPPWRRTFDTRSTQEPYDVLRKRFGPFWDRLMPDFVKQELAWQTPVTDHVASTAASQTPINKPRDTSFSQTSSYQIRSSQKAGSKPYVGAWASSWDSKTNKTQRSFYDPITGRMVADPTNLSESASRAHIPSQDKEPATASATFEEDVDQLTPSDVRATMAKNTDAEKLAVHAQQLATLEQDFKNKAFDSEHEELVEARKTLEALRAQVQILERKSHASTMTKPDDLEDAERPAVFEDGWNEAPQGMQTAFETEKEAFEHGEKKSLEEEMSALNSVPDEKINDGYASFPTGMQIQYALENSGEGLMQSLEQEMVALNKQPVTVTNDGYSTTPIGMQTLYEKEEVGSLEQELNEKLKRKEYDDGYSTTPSGMQTGFDREGSGALEKDLNDRLKRKEYDDGYSTAPTGLQGLYEKEDSGTLEQELNDKVNHKELDDGYSTIPSGMQTTYQKEDAGKLEKELNEKHKPVENDDGYSITPSGMQTQYEREDTAVLEKEFDNGLKQHEYDDGYSTSPKGLQSTFEQETEHVKHGRAKSLEQEMQEKHDTKAYDDGYSTNPSGLQTAYNTEKQQSNSGKRQSLEQEIKSQKEESPNDEGYDTTPIGLQRLFRQEQIEAEANKRKSLEDELKIKNHKQDHEDGYSKTPMGLQSSFRNEEQLKALQGEGDICTNVGKFCNSRRWYKQPATKHLSEEIQKAQKRAHDRMLAREIGGDYYGPITTEHQRRQEVLNKHEEGQGAKEYETKEGDESHVGEAASSTGPTSNLKWAEPAIYKVVAYDVHKEAISITTTPSNFSNSDSPISISGALSRLHQPARFIPHFAELQKAGYQVINASRDWLVLRKVDRGDQGSTAATETFVNPIDPKMTRRVPYEELPTGRFASPTGFVNHDPIFPPEPPKPAPGETVTVEIPIHGGPDVDRFRHRRARHEEEPVYSGVNSKRWRERRRDGYERRDRRRFRDRVTWVMSVGGATIVSMYVVGVVRELAKDEEKARK